MVKKQAYYILKNNYLILFFCISISVSATDSLLYSVEVASNYFTTDHLQNLYYINGKNEVIKYEFTSGIEYTYSDKRLGKPTYIDASNPMRVLVFFPDFYTVVILDNTCSAMNIINLTSTTDKNSYLPYVVCAQADENYFWIYDQLSRKLVKLDERGNKVLESEAFDALFSDVVLPSQLIYYNQSVYLIDKNYRVLLFDLYGTFHNEIRTQTIGYIQVIKNNFVFLQDNEMQIIDNTLLSRKSYSLPLPDVVQVRIHPNRLFLRTASQIAVYSVEY